MLQGDNVVEQTSISETASGKTDKPPYPRAGWVLSLRTVLLSRLGILLFPWGIPLGVLILYVFFNLANFVVQNRTGLTSLLSLDKDMAALIAPIEQYTFVSIPAFILLGIFVSLGYWAKADEKRENLFIEEVQAEKPKRSNGKPKRSNGKPKRSNGKLKRNNYRQPVSSFVTL